MSGRYSITTEGEEALAAATAETVLQLRGATTTKAKLRQWSISFDSTSATAEPVLVRLLRQTTDGTGTGATEAKWDPDSPAAACTGFHTFSSTEPTSGDILEEHLVYPGGVPLIVQYPQDGFEPTLDDAATSRIGITVNAPASVNVVATLVWDE
jgi:hypothetical protein